MSKREIPPSMDPAAVARIDERLAAIRRDEPVAIPLAIESGSRAWGFPSPDSDYDCRFIFVRPVRHYLSPWPRRDVIETPLAGELDVNGWDLGKALKLLVKGNAVLVEWLTSPITYDCDPQFRSQLLALARRTADRALIARHYLHLGERQRRSYFSDRRAVPQKKLFYALRPAAALRWLRQRPGEAIAPMNFPQLLAECEPPVEVSDIASRLMERKAVTRELGSEPLPAAIAAFIDAEFELARETIAAAQSAGDPAARKEAEAFFLATVYRLGPRRTLDR
jgi:predicted nucleotidyltransferase